ncbi:exonuclease domain-containing protein [Sphingobacterium sp. HJSM2_6]|uniref:exonuclease domain-containing protein n=1 Tax=Sphingobacterium sp. HJSM2_6 TaxID=3366264 RepID=UPI003BE3C60D
MKNPEYAIVDIETTGSYAAANGITEIAILIFDGKQVIEKFSTLINPLQPIPFHIQALTGISDDMLAPAPTFSEVAAQIFQLLAGRVFIAHNVHFDYSFIEAALKLAGYDWRAPKLCTVRLSRKIFKNLPSYSLGKLCQSLGIPIRDRHRAFGDAEATLTLFKMLLAADEEHHIVKATLPKAKEQRLPTHLPNDVFESLPQTTGIYLFKNAQDKIIYVGKAINIKKRVIGHFTGNSSSLRRQQFINEIIHIEFKETGTELMALLMECDYIKKLWPKYNLALKKYDPKYGLWCYEDQNGYLRLSIGQIRKHTQPLYYFNSVLESTQFLHKLIHDHQLVLGLCQFFNPTALPQIDRISTLSMEFPDQKTYNLRVQNALLALENQQKSFVIVDKGRNSDEKSFIYFKKNKLHAIGFIENELSFSHIDEGITQDQLVTSNFYMNNLAIQFAKSFPSKTHEIQGNWSE